MVKRIFVAFLLGASIISMMPLAVTAQESGTYAAHGPYAVGTLERVVEDAQRPLALTVWYPALNPDNLPEEVTYWASPLPGITDPLPVSGHAHADAAPNLDDGPYPLVIFSHGHYGFRHCSVYLMEHLASYGFVVMALDHVGDTMADLDHPDEIDIHIYRPQDITRLIDFAERLAAEDSVLKGLIDVEQIAVMGHSFGGYTALAVAGARLNLNESAELFCQNPDFISRDYGMCGTVKAADRLAQVAGLAETPDGLWPSLGDDRVDAVVALAAAQTTLFAYTGLKDVTIPALFMVGSKDFVPPEYYTNVVYEHISSEQKALVTFDGAGHLIFLNACYAVPWQTDEQLCSDPAWDMDQAHDLINHFVVAFLLATFDDDMDAAAALAPEAVNFPGVTYEAPGY